MARTLRPARADDLGLRRALSDRLLPLLVAAMVFLAALALAGALAAAALAEHWHAGAASMIMVQVPQPDLLTGGGKRADLVQHALEGGPGQQAGVALVRRLPPAEIAELLRPWLGEDPVKLSLPLPALFDVRLKLSAGDATALDAMLTQIAPGTLVERNGAWMVRLQDLVRSLQACAALALLVVAFIAAAVIMVATRAGLAARRDAIEIVHGLGATDGMIAGQFAGRVSGLAASGALIGLCLAIPVLLGLAVLAAPFLPNAKLVQGSVGPQAGGGAPLDAGALLGALPPALWVSLAALPILAAFIGWLTAQATVRAWLGRLA